MFGIINNFVGSGKSKSLYRSIFSADRTSLKMQDQYAVLCRVGCCNCRRRTEYYLRRLCEVLHMFDHISIDHDIPHRTSSTSLSWRWSPPGNQPLKFADDTYVIIPAVNADSRQTELKNSEEIVTSQQPQTQSDQVRWDCFVNKRRKVKVQPAPQLLLEIVCLTILNMLGITFTKSLISCGTCSRGHML